LLLEKGKYFEMWGKQKPSWGFYKKRKFFLKLS
jgi:hypothetical protein